MVSNVLSVGDKYRVRLISEKEPLPDSESVVPNLEDVCIFHFGEI